MVGRITLVFLLALLQLGIAEGIPLGYWLPNMGLAYLLFEAPRLRTPMAAWLGTATGFAQALMLTAPLGVEPLLMAAVGGLASYVYRNPLGSRFVVPLFYGMTASLVYQLLVDVTAWLRWGYPLLTGGLAGTRWIAVLLTGLLTMVLIVAARDTSNRAEEQHG